MRRVPIEIEPDLIGPLFRLAKLPIPTLFVPIHSLKNHIRILLLIYATLPAGIIGYDIAVDRDPVSTVIELARGAGIGISIEAPSVVLRHSISPNLSH